MAFGVRAFIFVLFALTALSFLATTAGTYGEDIAAERYHLAEQDPNLFGIPRMVRFGARWSF